MKTALKVLGIVLVVVSFLPGAFAAYQAYSAYKWQSGELADGAYGDFGREIAERGAEIRETRAMISGGVSFALFAVGAVLFVVGWRMRGSQQPSVIQPARPSFAPQPYAYGMPMPQPNQQQPQSEAYPAQWPPTQQQPQNWPPN